MRAKKTKNITFSRQMATIAADDSQCASLYYNEVSIIFSRRIFSTLFSRDIFLGQF